MSRVFLKNLRISKICYTSYQKEEKMLYILFSPSEGKNTGGINHPITIFQGIEKRKPILDTYKNMIDSKNENTIKTLFGFKKFDECQNYIQDIYQPPTMKAVQRYQGVAYDYLRYDQLEQKAQNFIDKHIIIFSNLFGPLYADDMIPIYKVKQGNAIGSIKPEVFYKEHFTTALDLLFEGNEILDLRAGYYDKFYKPKQSTTLKFLKNGKVVSHWAKAYRGIVLKEIAKHQLHFIDEIVKMEIENLVIKEIKQTKKKTEIVYEIIS